MAAKKKMVSEHESTLTSRSTRDLRDDAVEQIARSPAADDLKTQTPEQLVHELQVHQIELVMQAEELMKAKLALEESRDRYLDLYEFAPLGYLTLDDKAMIVDVNLAGATLLGVERIRLVNTRFRKFIAQVDLEQWDRYFVNVLQQEEKTCCTLTINRLFGPPFPARLESIRITDSSDGTPSARVAISDISDIRRAEEVQKIQHSLLKGILESTDSAIFSLDREYRYTLFNSHHAMVMKMLYGADIELGRSMLNYQSVPEDRILARLNINRALAGEQFTFEAFSGELARSRRHFEVTHNPVKDTGNNVVGVAVFAQDITDRKRADEALRESEERYRRITGGLTDYLYTVHVNDGRAVSTVHGAACIVVTGYSTGEFAADPYLWIRMVFDEDRDRVITHVNAILNGKPIPPVEHRIVRKDGQVRWVRDTPVLQLDDSGKLVSYDGVIKDITATKQAEEALRESEERYRAVADFTYDWEYWMALDGKFVYVSPSCERITGYRPEEFTLDPNLLITIIHADDRDKIIEHLAIGEKLNTEHGILEFRIITRKGEERWIGHECQPVYNTNGNYLGRRGSNRDITGRKQTEEAVRHLTEFQESIITNALVWLSVLDPAGKILVWNAAAAKISGYRAEEVLGNHEIWKKLYPKKEYRDQVTTTINRNIREKKYLENFETVIRTKEGYEKIISWNTKGIPDATGKRSDYIVIGMDVTDRHRAEEQLNKTVDELKKFNKLTVDRELRMIALKREVNALLKKAGEQEKYRNGP